MRQQAQEYAEQDRYRLQIAELKNQADSLFYTYLTTLKENGQAIPEQVKAATDEKQKELKEALRNPEPMDEIRLKLEEFRQAVLGIGTNLYQQSENAGSQSSYESSVSVIEEVDAEEPMIYEVSDTATVIEEEGYLDLDDETVQIPFEDQTQGFEDDETVSTDYEPVD
jgi:molecular chaperone DnaK